MLITTHSAACAALVAPYGLRQGDNTFNMAPATVRQLDRLCTVLTATFAGQWSVSFDGEPAGLSAEDLTEGVDGEHWQALLLAPSYIGADTEDFIHWLEEIYSQPVTNANYMRVMQLFRFWYASTQPGEYCNPTGAQPAKYALLSLQEQPETRRERQARAQKARRERHEQAAQRFGFATIDHFANAVLALSENEVAEVVKFFCATEK